MHKFPHKCSHALYISNFINTLSAFITQFKYKFSLSGYLVVCKGNHTIGEKLLCSLNQQVVYFGLDYEIRITFKTIERQPTSTVMQCSCFIDVPLSAAAAAAKKIQRVSECFSASRFCRLMHNSEQKTPEWKQNHQAFMIGKWLCPG